MQTDCKEIFFVSKNVRSADMKVAREFQRRRLIYILSSLEAAENLAAKARKRCKIIVK